MKQVLEDILLAEKQAEDIIREARNRAQQMTRESEIAMNAKKTALREKIRLMLQSSGVQKEKLPEYDFTDAAELRRLCGVDDDIYEKLKNEIAAFVCASLEEGGR